MSALRTRTLFLLASLHLVPCFPVFRAQSIATEDLSLLPGPKPSDSPEQWKQLVGIYGRESWKVIILERDGMLVWRNGTDEQKVQKYIGDKFVITNEDGPALNAKLERNEAGYARMLDITPDRQPRPGECRRPACYQIIASHYLPRIDAGADPTHFYHIVLSRPLDQLRSAALATQPPAEAGPFHKSDLVELSSLDPAIHLDIRYAQSNNFLSTPVYTQAGAFMQRPVAEAHLRVLHKLRPLGYGLLIHDAYRPWYVTKIFWDATPAEGHIFVADPKKGSRHNRGCAVDLTLYDLANGQPIEMPGLYDEMSPRSFPTFPGGTSLQRWHRDLLRRAMESEKFTVNEDEWWHFDYEDWKSYPILNVPFEEVQTAS